MAFNMRLWIGGTRGDSAGHSLAYRGTLRRIQGCGLSRKQDRRCAACHLKRFAVRTKDNPLRCNLYFPGNCPDRIRNLGMFRNDNLCLKHIS